jgi:hypothetical protein
MASRKLAPRRALQALCIWYQGSLLTIQSGKSKVTFHIPITRIILAFRAHISSKEHEHANTDFDQSTLDAGLGLMIRKSAAMVVARARLRFT